MIFYFEETMEDIDNFIEYKHRGELISFHHTEEGFVEVETLNGKLYYCVIENAGERVATGRTEPTPCYRWLVTAEKQEAQAYWKGWHGGR